MPEIHVNGTSTTSTFGSPTSTASTNYEEKMVHLFNHLLQKCRLDNIRPLNSYTTCNLAGLTEVYRAILSDLPINFIKKPKNDSEKVKNIQSMIDTIAADLEVDLSYIDASAIVQKEAIHLHNFVEILDGLLDFLDEKNECNASLGGNSGFGTKTDSKSGLTSMISVNHEDVENDETLEIKNVDFIGMSSTEATMSAEGSEISKQVSPRGENEQSPEDIVEKYLRLYEEIHNEQNGSDSNRNTENREKLEDFQIKASNLPETDFIWEKGTDSDVKSTSSGVSDEKPHKLDSPNSSHTLFSEIQRKISNITGKPPIESKVDEKQRFHEKQKSIPNNGEELKIICEPVPKTKENVIDRKKMMELDNSDRVKKHLFESESGTSDDKMSTDRGNHATRENFPAPSAGIAEQRNLAESTRNTENDSKNILNHSKLSQKSVSKQEWDELLQKVHFKIKHTPKSSKPTSPSRKSMLRPKTAPESASIRLQKALFQEKINVVNNAKDDNIDIVKDINLQTLVKLKNKVAHLEKESQQAQKLTDATKRSKTVVISSAYDPKHSVKNTRPKNNAAKLNKKYVSKFDQEQEVYDLIPNLVAEYPAATFGGDFNPGELQKLFKAQAVQVDQLNRMGEQDKVVTKLDKQIFEMASKYNKMSDILQKDADREARVQERKSKQQEEIQVARSIQEKRQHAASVKRFYKDYREGLQARLQVDRTAQQQMFKGLCKDALEVQRNRIKEKRTIQVWFLKM